MRRIFGQSFGVAVDAVDLGTFSPHMADGAFAILVELRGVVASDVVRRCVAVLAGDGSHPLVAVGALIVLRLDRHMVLFDDVGVPDQRSVAALALVRCRIDGHVNSERLVPNGRMAAGAGKSIGGNGRRVMAVSAEPEMAAPASVGQKDDSGVTGGTLHVQGGGDVVMPLPHGGGMAGFAAAAADHRRVASCAGDTLVLRCRMVLIERCTAVAAHTDLVVPDVGVALGAVSCEGGGGGMMGVLQPGHMTNGAVPTRRHADMAVVALAIDVLRGGMVGLKGIAVALGTVEGGSRGGMECRSRQKCQRYQQQHKG